MVIVFMIVISIAAAVAYELVTEPRDIDMSDCSTRWRDGRVVSVTCPAEPGG
jgi:hypothetical protein